MSTRAIIILTTLLFLLVMAVPVISVAQPGFPSVPNPAPISSTGMILLAIITGMVFRVMRSARRE